MSRIEKALEKANFMRKQGSLEGMQEDASASEKPAEKTRTARSARNNGTKAALNITSPYIVTVQEPESHIAEEYKKLKSMIVKLTKKGNLQNTLMVTSSVGGEGKSITALNLAVTMAQEYDHTVLLIDADLRQPSIHEYLGIKNTVGLSDCLTNGVGIEHALVKTDMDKLVFLAAGKRVSNPVELFLSSQLKDFVKEIKHRYADRYIIFDTPPVLPFAEVHSLGTLMDGVIFVIRERRSPLRNIKEALTMLKDSNILGVVYNDAEISRLDGNYYYYHRYKNSLAT